MKSLKKFWKVLISIEKSWKDTTRGLRLKPFLVWLKLTFVHSKCKRSSLRSQCWMRLFLWFSNTVIFLCSLRLKEVFCGLQVKCGEKEIRGCWRFKVTCKICPNDHWQSFKSLFDLLASSLTMGALSSSQSVASSATLKRDKWAS